MPFCFSLTDLFAAQRFNPTIEAQQNLETAASILADDITQYGSKSIKPIVQRITQAAINHRLNIKFAVFFVDVVKSLLFQSHRTEYLGGLFQSQLAHSAARFYMDSWNTGSLASAPAAAYLVLLFERGYILPGHFQRLLDSSIKNVKSPRQLDALTLLSQPLYYLQERLAYPHGIIDSSFTVEKKIRSIAESQKFQEDVLLTKPLKAVSNAVGTQPPHAECRLFRLYPSLAPRELSKSPWTPTRTEAIVPHSAMLSF